MVGITGVKVDPTCSAKENRKSDLYRNNYLFQSLKHAVDIFHVTDKALLCVVKS